MNERTQRQTLEHFRDELRQWARRPPRRSPATARARVLEELAVAQPDLWKLAATGAVLAASLAALVYFSAGPSSPPHAGRAPAQRMIVFELDTGTTLYHALPPAERAGDR